MNGGDNPADIGTRLKGIKSQDVYPGSDHLCGKAWMKLSKEDAIKQETNTCSDWPSEREGI